MTVKVVTVPTAPVIVHIASSTASSCTGHIHKCGLGVLINRLTISQGRCHCSKPYTTLYRMVCLNIDSDVVSFHSWAVIDQSHYEPCKMKLKILLLSPFSRQCRLTDVAFQTTLPNGSQVYLDWEGEQEVQGQSPCQQQIPSECFFHHLNTLVRKHLTVHIVCMYVVYTSSKHQLSEVTFRVRAVHNFFYLGGGQCH